MKLFFLVPMAVSTLFFASAPMVVAAGGNPNQPCRLLLHQPVVDKFGDPTLNSYKAKEELSLKGINFKSGDGQTYLDKTAKDTFTMKVAEKRNLLGVSNVVRIKGYYDAWPEGLVDEYVWFYLNDGESCKGDYNKIMERPYILGVTVYSRFDTNEKP